MDINKYMEQSLANQARQIALQEAILEVLKDINDNGVFIANADDAPVVVKLEGTPVVNVLEQTPIAIDTAVSQPEPDAPAQVVAETQVQAVAETKTAPVEEKKKGPTIDDARKALKAFAAIEGNDAAMKILESLGASSISGVAEKGGDALQDLINKCEGK